jgi:hypothetical protein
MRSQLHVEKMREIAECLKRCGRLTVDSQAKALGVSRSTAWAMLSGRYKVSGISARVVKQILSSQELPPEVRAKVVEYVADKVSGKFSCNATRLRRFRSRMMELGIPLPPQAERRLRGSHDSNYTGPERRGSRSWTPARRSGTGG